MIDKAWVVVGAAVIILPAIAYGEHLGRYVYRKWFGDESLDVLDEMADESRTKDAADPHSKSSAR